MKCVAERSKNLIETAFIKRKDGLLIKIRSIKGAMNARGILNSSTCVNEVCKACVTELQDFSEEIFIEIKRAHQSCGENYSKSLALELINLFEKLLDDTRTKLKGVQDQSAGNIANHLQNKALIQFDWLDNEAERLLEKYRTEITMYTDNLHRSSGSNLVERLKNAFFNNWLVALIVTVFGAMIALSAVTDAIQNISKWIHDIFN
jgi:hypothetical protein